MAQLGYVRREGKTTLSYSKFLTLHSCPRKFQLQEMQERKPMEGSVHTAYGHAFGAGVQELFRSRDLSRATVALFSAWDVGLEDNIAKDKKSLWHCIYQLELWYQHIWPSFDEWELAPNGIELLFLMELSQEYDYQGHIDVVVQHIETKALAVVEIKTTSKNVSLATYSNSNQTNGYQVVLHSYAKQLGVENSRKVFYVVAQPKSMFEPELNYGFTVMPFTKAISDNISFIHGVLLDVQQIKTYREAFFPKRGEHCESFFRTCNFFGACDSMINEVFDSSQGGLAYQALDIDAVHCHIKLDEMIEQLGERLLVAPAKENPNEHLNDVQF